MSAISHESIRRSVTQLASKAKRPIEESEDAAMSLDPLLCLLRLLLPE